MNLQFSIFRVFQNVFKQGLPFLRSIVMKCCRIFATLPKTCKNVSNFLKKFSESVELKKFPKLKKDISTSIHFVWMNNSFASIEAPLVRPCGLGGLDLRDAGLALEFLDARLAVRLAFPTYEQKWQKGETHTWSSGFRKSTRGNITRRTLEQGKLVREIKNTL